MPSKTLWVKRVRVLRALLASFRDARKIDRTLYHELRRRVKGNVFKNRRVLMEHIFKRKAENIRSKTLLDQAEAKKRGVRSKLKMAERAKHKTTSVGSAKGRAIVA